MTAPFWLAEPRTIAVVYTRMVFKVPSLIRLLTKSRVVVRTGCWEFTGHLTSDGYGQMWHRTKMMKAYRVAYELLIGPVPEGLTIDHLCRNRCCVNPAHLEAVTHTENVLRGFGPTAENARKTHCLNGHEFTPENTVDTSKYGRTGRWCRECGRIRSREYMQRKRAKQR